VLDCSNPHHDFVRPVRIARVIDTDIFTHILYMKVPQPLANYYSEFY
jgi:hypothetical protein